jgi:hypothetical protein
MHANDLIRNSRLFDLRAQTHRVISPRNSAGEPFERRNAHTFLPEQVYLSKEAAQNVLVENEHILREAEALMDAFYTPPMGIGTVDYAFEAFRAVFPHPEDALRILFGFGHYPGSTIGGIVPAETAEKPFEGAAVEEWEPLMVPMTPTAMPQSLVWVADMALLDTFQQSIRDPRQPLTGLSFYHALLLCNKFNAFMKSAYGSTYPEMEKLRDVAEFVWHQNSSKSDPPDEIIWWIERPGLQPANSAQHSRMVHRHGRNKTRFFGTDVEKEMNPPAPEGAPDGIVGDPRAVTVEFGPFCSINSPVHSSSWTLSFLPVVPGEHFNHARTMEYVRDRDAGKIDCLGVKMVPGSTIPAICHPLDDLPNAKFTGAQPDKAAVKRVQDLDVKTSKTYASAIRPKK